MISPFALQSFGYSTASYHTRILLSTDENKKSKKFIKLALSLTKTRKHGMIRYP
jgi:hypothetical protein